MICHRVALALSLNGDPQMGQEPQVFHVALGIRWSVLLREHVQGC